MTQPLRSQELIDSYQWLIDGLRAHCFDVKLELVDYGYTLELVVTWREGEEPKRIGWRPQAILYAGEHDARCFSWNDMIEKGIFTRQMIIAAIARRSIE